MRRPDLIRTWISMAKEVGGYLDKGSVETVTFLLGAGASISSGAPSTPEVIDALTEQFPDEFPDSKISEGMDVISDPQVETAIRPLFFDGIEPRIEPHVGYLSLAALAKRTRVLIVNLNWDPAVDIAALDRIGGVSCKSIGLDEKTDLSAGLTKIEECLADPELRIVNLHLHGRIDQGDIRLAPKRTAAFERETVKMLWNSFFIHPTVVVGASLIGERDVTGMLTEASQGIAKPKKTPFWIFSRQPEQTDLPDAPKTAELLSRNECELNFRGAPFVDFDRIMVEILAQRTKRPLKHVFAKTNLPEREGNQLVYPAPDLLRDYLLRNGRILALVGERKIGKSTTGRLLAHWEWIHSDDGIEINSHAGGASCGRAVAALKSGEATLAAEDVLILDEPFSHDEEACAELIGGLVALLGSDAAPRVIVTASPHSWHRVVAVHPQIEEYADLVAAKPTDWYEGHDLAALADESSGDQPAMATRRVLEGVASTPSRVRATNAGEYPHHDEEVIEDKLELLRELNKEVKAFLALVRFYELSRTVVPQVELAKGIKPEMPPVPRWAKPMLRASELIDEEHLLFAHYTDRVAFDRLYLEEQKSLRSTVVDLAYGRGLVNEVCEMWLLISRVREGELEVIAELVGRGEGGERNLLEWGPLLLEEAAHSKLARPQLEKVLELLLIVDEKRDFWALREFVYEVVRLWPELHSSPVAKRFVKRVLADYERMGRYCVFEAILYFQGAIHSGVWRRDYSLRNLWTRLSAAIWDLTEDVVGHGGELALIFDALAWSRPPLPERELLDWVAPILNALEQDETLKGSTGLTCLYHPDGQKMFESLGLDSPLADIGNLTERQMARAAEMVRWHYVHQSRGRALITRRRLEPANPHLLRREQRNRLVPKARAEEIEKFVKRMAHFSRHRGWAIHLAFNLWCTAGKFEADFLARPIAQAVEGDLGMVTAALTYGVPGGARDQMQQYFRIRPNRELLLTVMLEGCSVETLVPSAGAQVSPPRFMAERTPQRVHRELETEWGGRLQRVGNLHEPDFSREVYEILVEAAREGHVDSEAMWRLLHHVQRGDLRPMDVEVARAPRDQKLSDWLQGRGELAKIVVSVCLNLTAEKE
jgi:hypothetical protein